MVDNLQIKVQDKDCIEIKVEGKGKERPVNKVRGKVTPRTIVTKDGKSSTYYEIKLRWFDEDGELRRKTVSTGLPVKGNQTRAEDEKVKVCRELEEQLNKALEAKRVAEAAKIVKPPSGSNMLFSDLMVEWLEYAKNRKAKPIVDSTYSGYHSNVHKVIAPYFEDKGILLSNLTADDIDDFYEDQLERVVGQTVVHYHANITAALNYAVKKKKYIPYSIMGGVDRPSTKKFIGKTLNGSQLKEVTEALKETKYYNKLLLGVILGGFYGLRRSEIVGLRWESIDFDSDSFLIEHTVVKITVDGKSVLKALDLTKNESSYRTLPLKPNVRALLLSLKAEQEKNRKVCGNSYNVDESRYVYVDALGNRIDPDYLSTAFPKFLLKKGFIKPKEKNVRFHDLRHSCATNMIAAGRQLIDVSRFLGHANVAITERLYVHRSFNDKIASVNAVTWIDDISFTETDEVQEVAE